MRFNPVTGYEQFTCPRCGSFISIQPYIDLKSDYVGCPRCFASCHVPTLISRETDSKPYHPAQFRRESRLSPTGQKVSRKVVITAESRQLALFGGAL